MRLIDADTLIVEIKTCLWDWEYVNGIKAKTVLNQTITDIGNMPTIDAAPVVRCKDCVHANITGEGYIYGTCNHRLKGGIGHLITPQFFCAYGERKDDEPMR